VKRLIQKVKSDLRTLRAGKPGRRFTEYHDRGRGRPQRGASWKKAAYIIAGAALLVAGLILSLPPGVPGFLLWIPGLTLMITRLRSVAVFLDSIEALVRRLFGQDVARPSKKDD
jgi:hypothetical protein